MQNSKAARVNARLKSLGCRLGVILIAGSLAMPAQMESHYSLTQILSMLDRQDERRLYFQAHDTVVRATFVPAERKLLLDIVSVPAVRVNPAVIAKLPHNHSLVVNYLSGSFDSSLIIISCGAAFGDDKCDQHSRLHESLKVGNQIGESEKGTFDTYLQIIGKILR